MRIVRESRTELLKSRARSDARYEKLYQKGIALEAALEEALLDALEELQDAVWAFIFNNETVNDRLLELALGEG